MTTRTASDLPDADHTRAVMLGRAFGRGLANTLFKVTVTGAENVPSSGGVLFAPNHTAFVDGPLLFILSPRPSVVLAKAELFSGPWARLLRALGQIPVRRGSPDRAAVREGLKALRAGEALGVFSEGTRTTGDFSDVRDGLAYFALKTGVPVVPVAILGTGQLSPRRTGLVVRRAPVRIAFGEPIRASADGDPRARRTVAAASEQLHDQLRAHLSRERDQWQRQQQRQHQREGRPA